MDPGSTALRARGGASCVDRIDPRELGFDIVLRRGPECDINRWYPGNKEKLESLFPVYFGAP